MNKKLGIFTLLMLSGILATSALAQERYLSTTGPTPPPGVVSEPLSLSKAVNTISGVPPYLWRHGCGPTSVGMVIGYWDSQGFDDLIPGDASTQSSDVQQAIASGGSSASAMSPEQHYEDYARPEDDYGPLQDDDYITAGRPPHTDNCIADFMKTSRSSAPYELRYGWSWSNYILSAFSDYVTMISPDYTPSGTQYSFSTMTFDTVKTEIDNGRPMVFLVDSDGDGTTDHFVTVIGYDDGPPQQYIYYDTWNYSTHQAQFREISDAYTWGIMLAYSFNIVNNNPFAFTQQPHGGRFEEDEFFAMHVAVSGTTGTVSYQWVKDEVDIPMATTPDFEIAALTESDEGWYKCRVTDESKSLIESNSVFVEVVPAGSLPAANTIGLGIILLVCGILGVKKIRKVVA